MKLRKVRAAREIAGRQVRLMPAPQEFCGTRVVTMNGTSEYLLSALRDREFDAETVAELLAERFGADRETAAADAAQWLGKLKELDMLEM